MSTLRFGSPQDRQAPAFVEKENVDDEIFRRVLQGFFVAGLFGLLTFPFIR